MTGSYTVRVTFHCGEAEPTSGVLTLEDLSSGHRLKRASIRSFFVLLATMFCILIPLLHFVIVPIGLVVTAMVFSRAFAMKKIILHGEGICPACKAEFRILARKYSENFSDVCERCQRQVRISS